MYPKNTFKDRIYLLSTLILAITLSSCMTGRQLMKLKEKGADGTVQFQELNHISKSDTYTTISGAFSSQMGNTPKINLGVRASFQPINIGEFSFNAARNFTISTGLEKYQASESNVLKYNFGISYDLPLIKTFGTTEAMVPLHEVNASNTAYYTIMDVEQLTIIGLRFGGGHRYYDLESNGYASTILQQHDEVRFRDAFERGDMLIENGSYLGRVGMSFTHFIGTTFRAVNAEHDFRGVLHRKIIFYADLQVLAHAQSANIDIDYVYLDNPMTSFEQANELVDPTSFLSKRNIGFALGGQFTMWAAPISKLAIGVFAELGMSPGYYDKGGNGFYFDFGVQFGFGNAKK